MNNKPAILALLLLITAVICFAIFFAVPQALKFSTPNRWNNIPLGQKKFLVHQYLGKPRINDSTLLQQQEQWIYNRENGQFILNIFYNKDTVAIKYNLSFHYHLFFLQKNYALAAKELP